MVLGKRILTAVCGLPLVLWLVYAGGWHFGFAISLTALVSWLEYCRMLRQIELHPWQSLGILYSFLLPLCVWLGNSQEMVFFLVVLFLVNGARLVVQAASFSPADAFATVFGVMYVPLLLAFFVALRMYLPENAVLPAAPFLSHCAGYVYLSFIGTWASDTFAYFIGSRWGRRKLCPEISPGKTVEGALGGLAGTLLVVGWLGSAFAGLQLEQALLLGCLIGVAAPVGDLVESRLERYAGVKDSGAILPGHGGMLDRIDSLLFVLPVVYFYIGARSLFFLG